MPQLDITTFFIQITTVFIAFFVFFNFFSYYFLPNILLVLNLRLQNIFFLNKKITSFLCLNFANLQKKKSFFFLLLSFFDTAFRVFFEKFFFFFHSFFYSTNLNNIWKSFLIPFYFSYERITHDFTNPSSTITKNN